MARIALLSSDPGYYSTRRIAEALSLRGHQVAVVDPARHPLTRPLHLEGLDPGKTPADLAVPRLGTRFFSRSLDFLRLLESLGCVALQPPDALARTRRKSSVLLGALPPEVRPVPSVRVIRPGDAASAVKALGGYPVVAKPDRGTQGIGVAILHDEKSAEAYRSLLASLGEETLFQPLLADAEDLRVLVVGGKVQAVMSRTPPKDDFRANMHRGAQAAAKSSDGPWTAPAQALVRHLGLAMAGVDFLQTDDDLLLLEINGSPGLQGIEQACGKTLAEEIARACERKLEDGS